jgi:Domain of unknown function (DUF1906)
MTVTFEETLLTNADGTPRSLQDIELENAARDVEKTDSVTAEHVVRADAQLERMASGFLGALSATGTGFRVSSLGVDFSWAKPGANELAGHDFVMPYIPYPGDTGKSVTRAQVQAYLAADKVVILLWEVAAGDCLRGYNVGLAHGTQARISAYDNLGLPPGCVIIVACDTDTTFPAVKPYVDGFSAGLGGLYSGGLYGGVKVTDPGVAAGYVGFQTIAWSYGVVGKGHVLQNGFNYYPNGTTANCDRDIITRTPVGGWGERGFIPQEGFLMALTDAQQTDLYGKVTSVENLVRTVILDINHLQSLNAIRRDVLAAVDTVEPALAALRLQIAGLVFPTPEAIADAVAEKFPAGVVDVAALAAALAPLLPQPLTEASVGTVTFSP